MPSRTILITGAAGNLGGLLAKHLLNSEHSLRLMIHKTPPSRELEQGSNVEIVHADLSKPETLKAAVEGVHCIVHFAGVLFSASPEKFLPTTNTQYFSNLLDAAIKAKVERIVLISFPHVEGPTTPEHPATGRLDGNPISVHAKTRLEEEKLLFERTRGTSTTPVSLRLGMVYGRGILMVDAARWFAKHRLLGVWKDPTWIHLISTADYLAATTAAAVKEGISGIYHGGDEQPMTLQAFLDQACEIWGYPKPWRMPLWMIRSAASLCEAFSAIFKTRSPLTQDFIEIGRVSYTGETKRFREDLLPQLIYPTFETGKSTLIRKLF